ncbi:MAG: cytochrome c-type biogenesis protein [Brevefilum sp.]
MTSKNIKSRHTFLAVIFIANIFILQISTFLVTAQTPTPSDDDVNRIAGQLFCPVCENVPLDECQIAACDQWRELIREKLAEGWSDDEIKVFFVAQYGDRVLGEPPRRGAHWLLYVLPPAVFVIGLGLLFSKLRRKPITRTSSDADFKDPYLKKVEEDLNNMENV